MPALASGLLKWLAGAVGALLVFRGVLDDRYVQRSDFVRLEQSLTLIQYKLDVLNQRSETPKAVRDSTWN